MTNKASMIRVLSNVHLKRKTITEYNSMKKPELIRSFISFISNFDKLRRKVVEIQLENNYLNRTVKLQDDQLLFYKETHKPRKNKRTKKGRQ